MNLEELKQKAFEDITKEEMMFLVENISFDELFSVFKEAYKRNATDFVPEEYKVNPAPDFSVTKIKKNIK
jgi:hypothetical protein